jgi:hypothetical protein
MEPSKDVTILFSLLPTKHMKCRRKGETLEIGDVWRQLSNKDDKLELISIFQFSVSASVCPVPTNTRMITNQYPQSALRAPIVFLVHCHCCSTLILVVIVHSNIYMISTANAGDGTIAHKRSDPRTTEYFCQSYSLLVLQYLYTEIIQNSSREQPVLLGDVVTTCSEKWHHIASTFGVIYEVETGYWYLDQWVKSAVPRHC